jgi:L-threonylcarbamoyladenylate synthase
MKSLTLDPVRMGVAAERAVRALRDGGVVLFPAERLYGLAADALNSKAVARVFALKGRDPGQPLPVIVGDAGVASEWVVLAPALSMLVRRFWPGPLTLVLPTRRQLAPEVTTSPELGIRIPGHPLALEMAKLFGTPVTATSANESGQASGRTVADALAGLAGEPDLVIDAGDLPGPPGSTEARYRDRKLEILRPGIIPAALLEQCIPRQP